MGLYASRAYASTWSHVGDVVAMPRSGVHLLARRVHGTARHDLASPHPRIVAEDLSALRDDLRDTRVDGRAPLSSVLVLDPALDEDAVRAAFDGAAVVRPFKTHHLSDLRLPAEQRSSSHHRYYARRSAKDLAFEVLEATALRARRAQVLDDVMTMYAVLVERHGIAPDARLTRASVADLLGLDEAYLVRADLDGRTVGAMLWLLDGDRAYNHLHVMADEGYRRRAAYGLYAAALDHAAGRGATVADIGAGAGANDDPDDGLARFKQGWGTERRTAWLVGTVHDAVGYAEVCGTSGPGGWFPAYRRP